MSLLKRLDGRYFGRTHDGYFEALRGIRAPSISVGPAGSEVVLFGSTGVSSVSTASVIPQGGVTLLAATAARDHTLAAPVANVGKVLSFTGATTLAQTVALVSGTFLTTAGQSSNKLSFDLLGESVHLMGLSSTLMQVVSNQGAVAYSTA